MKRTKKLLVAVMTMLLSLPLFCATALAEDGHTFVVKQSETGYTYLLYQIFKGDASTNSSNEYVLSNIEWGNGVKEDTQSKVYTMFGLTGADKTAAKVAEAVASSTDNDVFHSILINLGTNNGSSLQNDTTLQYGTHSITTSDGQSQQVTGYGTTDLADGYYLVRNTVVPEGQTYSDYIVKVVGGDVVSDPKAATPSSNKKNQDVNDSISAELSTTQDSSDYDIGDGIPFTLTAVLPMNYSHYKECGYYLSFVDDMSEGLTWDGKATIFFGAGDTTGTQIEFQKMNNVEVQMEDGPQTVNTSYTNGQLWRHEIQNLFADAYTAYNLQGGSVITVKYTATLNANANVGRYGNKNKFRIYYSNNPTVNSNVGVTPDDVNVVFTYKAVFNKTDGSSSLTGADFKLEKFVANQNGTATINNPSGSGTIKGTWTDVTQLHTDTDADNPTKSKDTNESTFTFAGLDDGVYMLTEIQTPVGYNTMDPIQFTITAEHEITSTSPELTALAGTDGAEFVMSADLDNATLTADIVNNPGLVLPSTGGMGTTVFYVAGSLLLGGSVVALVVKRRMRAE